MLVQMVQPLLTYRVSPDGDLSTAVLYVRMEGVVKCPVNLLQTRVKIIAVKLKPARQHIS